jgi:predicted transcriptional regulator
MKPRKPRRLTPFGVEVKKKLIDLGMTQKEFCMQHNISEPRLSELIYGAKPRPKVRAIVTKALGIKVTA